ncbi:MAG: FKBP-type peptidyl-prolyl cis-trans isomerase [Nitrospinae bacterium]|nr:FKBP-type peptidyl-prolyl cis-trans isomerase [Nitrospinota bacterium]
MKVKKGDFIEIDYVAKLKDENKIFDLTSEEIAKKENIYNEKFTYKPLVLCVGERHVIKGLDSALIDKEVGKEFTLEVEPEDGFGKKDGKLIQLVSTGVFTKQKIRPFPGLQVQIDDMTGIIKTVSGGSRAQQTHRL